ncbi:flavodoxin family protein [Candidatus Latescibacterota bacterium]
MTRTYKILTILGSPHDRKSNTRALVDDFVQEVANAGLQLEHQVISLGRKTVLPCKGCWNCTRNKPCPQSAKDDLDEIKTAMIDCDMLIIACPVYTNQITAQLKALFDRLFTWCHIFPLLGKYSLSACTTGGDGIEKTSAFIEKMLATYGTYSFGTISSRGGFTPGLFPLRGIAREKYRKLARHVASTLIEGKRLSVNAKQKKMFKVMKRKMMGIHTVNYILKGNANSHPTPPWLFLRLIKRFIMKFKLSDKELQTWSELLSFELDWWKDRGWLNTRSFKDLVKRPIPDNFDARRRLLREYGMIEHSMPSKSTVCSS